MLFNLKGIVEKNLIAMHLGILLLKSKADTCLNSVSLCYTEGVGSLPYLGLSCLLFSCCECGCGRASSLCAVAHPSLIWLVFPSRFHTYVMSHLYVLSSAFLFFSPFVCILTVSARGMPKRRVDGNQFPKGTLNKWFHNG